MKKMIYEMNMEWNWIKQRPHFIAEEFLKYFDMTILYQYRYNRKGFQHREVKGEKLIPVRVIPLIGRSLRLHQINVAWLKFRFGTYVKAAKPDYVFVTRPEMIGSVKGYKGKVIYDCMDDYCGFARSDWMRRLVIRDEGALVKRSDVVFVSSAKLKESLQERYGKSNRDKIHIVRNGFKGTILPPSRKTPVRKDKFVICYFGTIDFWFDFDLLFKSLEEFPDIEYLLMGPTKKPVPKHDRIKYIGTVEHDRLGEVTADADCFIMPFIVNELVEAVDPVKLYEYINFDKNILCVYYKEVERFTPFVRFYKDYASCAAQIRALKENNEVSYSEEERESFLKENGWAAKAQHMAEIIEAL